MTEKTILRAVEAVPYEFGWLFERFRDFIPGQVLAFCMSEGTGPWSGAAIVPPADTAKGLDSLRARLPNGCIVDSTWRDAHNDPGFKLFRSIDAYRSLTHASIRCRQFEARRTHGDMDYEFSASLTLMRQHSLLVAVEDKDHTARGIYVISQLASGHERLEELATLEQDFPGMFSVAGQAKDGIAE